MIKFKIYSLLSLLLVCASCTKEETTEEAVVAEEAVMQFSVEQIAQTKVEYSGLTATFTDGENAGLYTFYNNFYYYYNDYGCFAESVIFANQGVTLYSSGVAEYSPMRSWTFSTIYGTAPHTIDCMAYYPFRADYNPDYVVVETIDNTPTIEYNYYSETTTTTETTKTVNSDIDFMTAHYRYAATDSNGDSDPETFRTYMLALGSIPLTFNRQTASLNLKVTKPDEHTDEIVVTGITVYFDAYTKFTQKIDNTSAVSWSEMWSETYKDETTGDYLTTSKECNATLAKTGWDDIPTDGATTTTTVANLLEDSNMLFFPPEAEIQKIVFTLTDGSEAKEYTWHPHMATIEANTHYTLNLELDPERAN